MSWQRDNENKARSTTHLCHQQKVSLTGFKCCLWACNPHQLAVQLGGVTADNGKLRFIHIWVSALPFWSHFVQINRKESPAPETAGACRQAKECSGAFIWLNSACCSWERFDKRFKLSGFLLKTKRKTPFCPVIIERWFNKITRTSYWLLPSARKRYETFKLFRCFFWSKLNAPIVPFHTCF